MADFEHADVWLAIATISPVVFVANVVALTQLLRAKQDALMWSAYTFSVLSTFGTGFVIWNALHALEHRRDGAVGVDVAIITTLASMVFTYLAALFAGGTERK